MSGKRPNKGGRYGYLDPVSSIEKSEGVVEKVEIDMEELWKLLYEYQRYAHAAGFGDTQMEVLRVIEFSNKDRITAKEIKQNDNLSGYAEGTVHEALDRLVDANLVRREQRGLYRYTGP